MYSFRLAILLLITTSFTNGDNRNNNYYKTAVSEFKKIKTTDRQFSILTLNTWGLPFELEGHDHETRFPKIIDAVNTAAADILCLQEIFNKSLRNRIKKEISKDYIYEVDLDCDRRALGLLKLDCHGGLITLSKYPVLEEEFILFPKSKNRNIIEKVGAKGFLMTKLLLPNNSKLAVINTHLRSQINEKAKEDRTDQIHFIRDYIDDNLRENVDNIILTGDLNMNHPAAKEINTNISSLENYYLLTESMNFINPSVEDPIESATIGAKDSKYSHSIDGIQILDYCMYQNIDQNKSISIFQQTVCFNGANAVSDHNGLVSIFDMGGEELAYRE